MTREDLKKEAESIVSGAGYDAGNEDYWVLVDTIVNLAERWAKTWLGLVDAHIKHQKLQWLASDSANTALSRIHEFVGELRELENIIEYLFLNLTRYMVIPKDVEMRINNMFQKQGE